MNEVLVPSHESYKNYKENFSNFLLVGREMSRIQEIPVSAFAPSDADRLAKLRLAGNFLVDNMISAVNEGRIAYQHNPSAFHEEAINDAMEAGISIVFSGDVVDGDAVVVR